ncbi:hypothetical protein VTL71DRAFT_2692 [Oculimacula yallundae]|uniref:2EXR domain-containing protein n=1 Tax=Oculimacula yallundae TaxID=86028 RepID=A0ABR4CAY8_9HELO
MLLPHLLPVAPYSAEAETKSVSTPSKMEHSFSRFSDLPTEIRLLIWEATIEPQIVHLRQRHVSECYHAIESVSSDRHVTDRCSGTIPSNYQGRLCQSRQQANKKEFDRMDRIRGRPWLHHTMGFDTDSPTPALLLACRESYYVASKIYTKSFSSLGSIAQTYFNFKTDTLYLDKHTETPTAESIVQDVLPYMCQDELAKVEKLAVNRNLLEETMGTYENYLACILYFFKNVKTVYLTSDTDLYEKDKLENAASRRKSQPLVMYEGMETYQRATPARNCTDCDVVFQRLGLSQGIVIKIFEDEIHAQGKKVCEGRGQEWLQPDIVQNMTISTAEMKSRIEELRIQCREEIKCGCYDLTGADRSDAMSVTEDE